MPCQAKTVPLEYLNLDSVATLFDTHKLLYDFGYRGTLQTTATGASLAMSMPDNITISAGVGDVILYRTSPTPAVVDCISHDAFIAGYNIS